MEGDGTGDVSWASVRATRSEAQTQRLCAHACAHLEADDCIRHVIPIELSWRRRRFSQKSEAETGLLRTVHDTATKGQGLATRSLHTAYSDSCDSRAPMR